MNNPALRRKRLQACVILPPGRQELIAVERLRDVARLDVHVITYGDPPEVRQARKLGKLTPELARRCPELEPQEARSLTLAEIAIARDLPLSLEQRAPALRWVQAVGAGIEQLDPAGLAALNITLTNASGVAAVPIAEYVMAHLLALWKNVRVFDTQQKAHSWKLQPTVLAAGRVLGIVGLGAIGRATAKRARAFGMQVFAVSRRAESGADDADVDRHFAAHDVDAMLAQCDAVLASLPATHDTIAYFDAVRFGQFKPGAIFCNVARGSVVDEPALIAALDRGQIAHAVLDVTAVAPNPPDSPLWEHSQVVLTPHASTSMEGYGDRLMDLFIDNIARYQAGDPLRNIVDPRFGY